MNAKKFGVTVVLVGALAGGALVAQAQENPPPTDPQAQDGQPGPMGGRGGRGGQMGGDQRGGRLGEDRQIYLMQAVMDATGLNLIEVSTQVRDGATLGEIVTANGGSIDAALIAAEYGVPTGFMTMSSCLTTGPATMAGTLAVGNAEVIAATALLQLAYPGAPVFYAAALTATDPRSGAYTGGGPEDFLFGAAVNALSDFYNIPLSMCSFATGAK